MWRHLAEEAQTRLPLFVFHIGISHSLYRDTKRGVRMPSNRVSDCRASRATRNEDWPDSPTVKQNEGTEKQKMFCMNCGVALQDGAAFCSKCGAKVADICVDETVCETGNCESQSVVASQGMEKHLASRSPTAWDSLLQPSNKSRFIYQLLAFLFGGLGVHNFYASRIPAACAQILLMIIGIVMLARGLTPVPWILLYGWVVIEIFAVHCDGKGRPFSASSFSAAVDEDSADTQTQEALSRFKLKSRRSTMAIFLCFLIGMILGAIAAPGESLAAILAGLFTGIGIAVFLWLAWYYYARSKGYGTGWSAGLAVTGFVGTLTFPIGLLLPAIAFSIAKKQMGLERNTKAQ